MKVKILIGILLLITITNSLFANADSINRYIRSSFRAEFTNAKELRWEKIRDITKVSFQLDGETFYAYYTSDASLISVARDITLNQLPFQLSRSLKRSLTKRRYRECQLVYIIETSSENEGTNYYIVLRKQERLMILKSNGSGDLEEKSLPIPLP
jgi:hypothetical protein